jgi:hypothetical protein
MDQSKWLAWIGGVRVGYLVSSIVGYRYLDKVHAQSTHSPQQLESSHKQSPSPLLLGSLKEGIKGIMPLAKTSSSYC